MRNVSGTTCTENQNKHIVFNNVFLKNRAVYEIMWKNIAKRGSPRERIASWLPRVTNTHTLVV